jgi:hypothetical protein
MGFRKECKEMIDELKKQAMSRNGLLALAWNVRLAQVFPDWPDEEKYQPIKILIKEDSAYVYTIWNDGPPCLDIYDHPTLVHFEEAEGKIRINTIEKPAECITEDTYESMSREEYIEWFLETYELTRDEFEKISVQRDYEGLPVIEILRMA